MSKLPVFVFAALRSGAAMSAELAAPAYDTYQAVPFVVGAGAMNSDPAWKAVLTKYGLD